MKRMLRIVLRLRRYYVNYVIIICYFLKIHENVIKLNQKKINVLFNLI